MNVFEIERTFYVGVGATIGCSFLGIIIGLLAKFKGYSFLAWFGTGGAILLGAIVLAFQPKVRGLELTTEEARRKTEKGNRVGWLLSLAVYLCILLSIVVWLMSVSFEAVDSEQFLQRYFVPAIQWSDWPWTIAVCLMLVRFLYLPRRDKSLLTTVVFTFVALKLIWPIVEYSIHEIGLFEDPNSPTLRILNFTFNEITGISTLFLYFIATEPKKNQAG